MVSHVLVAYDGSAPADRALAFALAEFRDATVTLLHVVDPVDAIAAVEAGGLPVATDWYDDARESAEKCLENAIADERTGSTQPIDREVIVGKPARAVVDYAIDNDVDHVVVGSHGRSGVARVLLGSVAERVVRRAPMPVTIVR